jgi:hypothetical protein
MGKNAYLLTKLQLNNVAKAVDQATPHYALVMKIVLDLFDENTRHAVQVYLLTPHVPHGLSISKFFHDFAKKECALSGRPIAHLVSPSGLFRGTARLGIFAHYPTFRSKTLEFGETSDATNPCMRMLIKAGLDTGRDDIDQWELWHRRESTRDRKRHKIPWQSTSPAGIKVQAEFAQRCLTLSNPKIVLLLGIHVEEAFLQMVSAALTVSTVNAGGLSLYLIWKEMALVLMAVACPHPETVFHDESQKFGLLIDAAIELAVTLAGLEDLEIDHSYFQGKASAMQPNIRRTETMWSLGPRDSRVMLICRMRNWEKANDELICYEKIPIEMIEAYAEKIGIFDTSEKSIISLLRGEKGLVEAILASYTEASHHACSERGFDNLIKANEVQKSFGYRASLKARDNRIAEADARNITRGINPLKQWSPQ